MCTPSGIAHQACWTLPSLGGVCAFAQQNGKIPVGDTMEWTLHCVHFPVAAGRGLPSSCNSGVRGYCRYNYVQSKLRSRKSSINRADAQEGLKTWECLVMWDRLSDSFVLSEHSIMQSPTLPTSLTLACSISTSTAYAFGRVTAVRLKACCKCVARINVLRCNRYEVQQRPTMQNEKGARVSCWFAQR
jgi:hypothetical protein